jgi:hypothetical protein
MSDVPPRGEGPPPLSLGLRIEPACDRFELAWQAGQRPRIEDYLGELPEPGRSALARELIALEIDYRRRAGEDPRPDEYRARFPDLDVPPTVAGQAGPGDPGLPAVPGYEILQELGRGGMGVVYAAWQAGLNRTVALKMILAGGHAGPEELARFRTEAEAVARLQHPHIVQIHEIGQHEGRPYITLEYVDGGSLARQLSGTPWPARRAAELVQTLARAIDHAHGQGVVHRDLTPANVLLTRAGLPKVTDFGLAKVLVGGGPTLTQTGAILVKSARLAAALRDSEAKRWESLRDQARALRVSRHPGQRVRSLQAIREALRLPLPPGHSLDELRTEAIAALALPDLELLREEWEGWPAGTVGLDFDGHLERYARLMKDGTVSVRRVSDDTEIARWQEPTEGDWPYDESNLRFSPDGQFLCIRHRTSGRLAVRRVDGPEPAVCHEGAKASNGWAMDFSPDGKRLAYLRTDSRIAVVDLTSGQPSYLDSTGAVQDYPSIRFAPDGRRFALATHRAGQWAVEVRDAVTGQVQGNLPHPEKVNHPTWHPDGRTLATCCDDLRIRLWDVASDRPPRELAGHKTRGINCAFNRTGDRLLSNDWHDVLRVWEPSSGRQLLSLPASGSVYLRVSPDDCISARPIGDVTKFHLLRLHPGLESRTIDVRGGTSSRGIDYNALPLVHPGGRLLAAMPRAARWSWWT